MKIAFVHGFLKEYGGAERVLEVLHEMYPEAPVYTAFVDYNGLGPHAKRIRKWDIRQSRFGSSWIMKKFHSPLRFLTQYVWREFDFSGYDIVISSSAWYICRGITVKKPTLHISYVHTPPRHLYGYQTARNWQKYLPVRIYANIVNHFLRIYDFEVAQKVDYYIANSKETKRRITKFYRRGSEVIYPPVGSIDQKINKANNQTCQNYKLPFTNYYLVVSRLARAKHIDIAIEACQKLVKNLVIVGKGTDEERLKSLIKRSNNQKIKMLGEVPDEQLPELYRSAKALLFTAEDEEFGIVPVEAMSYGTPVIAYRSGGVVETVVEGKTGLFFDELTAESLVKAIRELDTIKTIAKVTCKKRANKFSRETFERRIRKSVENA